MEEDDDDDDDDDDMSSDENKFVPVYDVKVCGGSRSRTPLILNLGSARWT